MATTPSQAVFTEEVQASTIGDQVPNPPIGTLALFSNQNDIWYAKNHAGTVTALAGVTSVTNSDGTIVVTGTATAPIVSRAHITGDIDIPAGSNVSTLASIIASGGPTGSASVVPVITYDAKGRLLTVTTATITPAAIGAVPTTRLINTTAPITGGGDLSADRTIALTTSPAGQTPVGVTRTITTTTPLQIGGGASADLSADRTLSILETGSGSVVGQNNAVIKPRDIEGVAYVDTANTQGWAGSDAGAWINSAFSYLLTTYGTATPGGVSPAGFTGAGTIHIAPGVYTFTTPIVCCDQWFSIKIEGSGEGVSQTPTGTAGKGGTVLNYTPTSGIALTIGGASSNNGGVQIRDLALFGGTVGTNAVVPGGTAVGIQYGLTGGSPPPGSSTAGATVTNVAVVQFATGLLWNASGSIAYAVTHINCKVQYCATGAKPFGEANTFFGGLIGNCTTGVDASNAGTDLNCYGLAFDDNTTQAINMSNATFRSTMSGCRFENAGGGTDLYATVSNGSLTLLGGSIQSDVTTGTSTGFANISGGYFVVRDTWLLGQGTRVFTQAFNATGGVCRITPQIAPGSVGINDTTAHVLVQPGFADLGVIARNRNGVTSGTGETLLFNARIPPNATGIMPGTVFRIRVYGNSSSTGTLTFRVRSGTAGTVADANVLWNPATSAAQVANHRSSLECLVYVTATGASGAITADGTARYSNVFVEETAIAAPATSATNMTAAWFLDVTCACSIGTFTVDMGTIEIL